MELKNNWQTYCTSLKNQEALITVNLEIAEKLDANQHQYVVHFLIPQTHISTDFNKNTQQYLEQLSQTLLPLMAISDSLFAGYIIAEKNITLYFYAKEVEHFKAILRQMDFIPFENIYSQADPNYDLYYDFLLPSELDMKLNATKETLDILLQEGEDLSKPHKVTHKFQFENKEFMEEFIDFFAQQISYSIRYTDKPVQYDNDFFYLVTLEHNIALDDSTIFNLVEQFESQAANYHAEYNGWECQMLTLSDKLLH